MMKRNDWFLIGIVLLVAAGCFLAQFLEGRPAGAVAVVSIDGKETGRYSLEKAQRIVLETGNTLVIEEGMAKMEEASCPDQYCVKQSAISRSGESIICLPHKVVVEIAAEERQALDGISQ